METRRPKQGEVLSIANAKYDKSTKRRPVAELEDRRFLFSFAPAAISAKGPFEAFERPEGSGTYWLRAANGAEFGSCTSEQMSEFLVRKDLGEVDVRVVS